MDQRGWATVGDLGHLNDDGYLYLSGRRTDLIISGGVNICPREVEEALLMHPAVADVAVIGVPDRDLGQRVHAVIQPELGVDVDAELEAELSSFLCSRVARFKQPRSYSFDDDFPRMESGKVRKHVLVDRYAMSSRPGPDASIAVNC